MNVFIKNLKWIVLFGEKILQWIIFVQFYIISKNIKKFYIL